MSEATIIMTGTGPIGLVQTLPDRSDLSVLTENELSWIGFIRAVSDHSDPPPSLAIVQAIRLALGEPRHRGRDRDRAQNRIGRDPAQARRCTGRDG